MSQTEQHCWEFAFNFHPKGHHYPLVTHVRSIAWCWVCIVQGVPTWFLHKTTSGTCVPALTVRMIVTSWGHTPSVLVVHVNTTVSNGVYVGAQCWKQTKLEKLLKQSVLPFTPLVSWSWHCGGNFSIFLSMQWSKWSPGSHHEFDLMTALVTWMQKECQHWIPYILC